MNVLESVRSREQIGAELSAKLEDHRLELGLTDVRFAELLKVSRQYWTGFRANPDSFTIGPSFLLGVAKSFDDCKPLVREAMPFCRGASAFVELATLVA